MMRVWDPLVRGLHWALVAAVAAAWLTTDRFVAWHEPAGYFAAALVITRIAWGLVGGRYARFAQFVPGVRSVRTYVAHIAQHREPRYLGHNPLGGWMVLALLACIASVCLTGWLYTTDRFWGEVWLDRLHTALAWGLVGLIVIHVAGVFFTGRRHHENLVRAMVDGKKRAPVHDDVV